MIDSHCHIDLSAFDEDRAQVLESAQALGVQKILVPGLAIKQLAVLLRLQSQYSMLDIAAGFHPYFLPYLSTEQWQEQLKHMQDWLEQHHSQVVAIGEFGLDATLKLPMDFQQQAFLCQVQLAKDYNKPVVLHHRKSHNEIIRLLKQTRFSQGGVIHAFSGSEAIAKTYIDMGFKLGIGGTITYPRGAKTCKAIKDLSLSDLLLETDAPDMPLYGFQGQRNTPERLPIIAKQLAVIKGVSVNLVTETTTANYKSLFSSMLAP
jgi:TatD DNase family protein